MAQQTSIDYLVESLKSWYGIDIERLVVTDYARAQHEKEIVKAVDSNFSYDSTEFPTLGEQYYNNTYKI